MQSYLFPEQKINKFLSSVKLFGKADTLKTEFKCVHKSLSSRLELSRLK